MVKALALFMLACLVSHALASAHEAHADHDHGDHEIHDPVDHHEYNHDDHVHHDHDDHDHHDHEEDNDDDCPIDDDDDNHSDHYDGNHASHDHDNHDDNGGNHAGHDDDGGNHAGHDHGSHDDDGNHAGHDHGSHDDDGGNHASHDHWSHGDDDGNHAGHDHEDHEDHTDYDDEDDHKHHDHGGYDGKEGDCPSTEHDFDGHHWYIKLMGKTPQMQQITFCAYITTDERGMIPGVIGSIHTDNTNKNLIVLGKMHKREPQISIIVEGQVRNVQTTLPPNAELHMCMKTNRTKNTVTLYLNGVKTRDLQYYRVRGLSPGDIMIGRMKNDKFDMYRGKIRNFMMWDKMLTAEEIKKIYEHNYCPGGAKVVLLPDTTLPLKNNVPTEDCPDIDFSFDNTGDKVEYTKLSTIKAAKYATVCAKVTSDATGMLPGTVASYGTHDHPEMLSVGGGRDSDGKAIIIIIVDGHKTTYNGQFLPSTTYSFCMQYHFPHGHFMTYINGVQNRIGMMKGIDMLPGGGTIIIGQRQRKQGRCFDRKHAFNGRISDFKLWTRALSDKEMMQYAMGKCATDANVTLSEEYILPSGDATFGMCPVTEFTLVNQGIILEYVAVSKTISDTEFLTVCNDVTTNAVGAIPGIIASYSTSTHTVTVAVGGETGPNGPMIRITVNGKTVRAPAQFMPNTKCHFCIQFHTIHDHALMYINGKFASEYTIEDMGFIPGGGTIIIGQLQGCVGGCFERDAAFNGKVGRFMVWDRFLSRSEIEGIEANNCPLDYVIDLTKANANKASSMVAE